MRTTLTIDDDIAAEPEATPLDNHRVLLVLTDALCRISKRILKFSCPIHHFTPGFGGFAGCSAKASSRNPMTIRSISTVHNNPSCA